MIYFVLDEDLNRLKLGFTQSDLYARFCAFEKAMNKALVFTGQIDGGGWREKEIHTQFVHLQYKGSEWFEYGEDLRNFVAENCNYLGLYRREALREQKHELMAQLARLRQTERYREQQI